MSYRDTQEYEDRVERARQYEQALAVQIGIRTALERIADALEKSRTEVTADAMPTFVGWTPGEPLKPGDMFQCIDGRLVRVADKPGQEMPIWQRIDAAALVMAKGAANMHRDYSIDKVPEVNSLDDLDPKIRQHWRVRAVLEVPELTRWLAALQDSRARGNQDVPVWDDVVEKKAVAESAIGYLFPNGERRF